MILFKKIITTIYLLINRFILMIVFFKEFQMLIFNVQIIHF